MAFSSSKTYKQSGWGREMGMVLPREGLRSTLSFGCHVSMFCFMNRAAATRARATASILSDKSRPTIVACGKAAVSNSVPLPGPQPRSKLLSGSNSGKKERDVVRSAEQILRGNKLSSSDIQEFQRELKEISSSKRWEIAYKADENRRQHWEKDKEPMERSLLIFQALVKTDEAETVHWWYGSLGYCLKDKRNPDYAEAAERLDTAIKIRGPETRSGAYEFNRAFCNIQLAAKQLDGTGSRTLKEQIRSDLKTARNFQRFKDIIDKDSTVQEWLEKDVGMRPT